MTLDSNGDGIFDAGDAMFTFGLATDTFVVGDWNGSGYDSVGVVRDTRSGVAQWTLDTNEDCVFDAGDSVYNFGFNTDKPVAGDWTGSGTTKIGVVRALPTARRSGCSTPAGTGVYTSSDAVYNFGLRLRHAHRRRLERRRQRRRSASCGRRRRASCNGCWTPTATASSIAGDSVFYFGLNGDMPVVGDWNGTGKDGDRRGAAPVQWHRDLDAGHQRRRHLRQRRQRVRLRSGQRCTSWIGKWKPPQALLSGDGVLNGLRASA